MCYRVLNPWLAPSVTVNGVLQLEEEALSAMRPSSYEPGISLPPPT